MYDFGDSWAHRLSVSAIRQGAPDRSYPRYVGGEWDAPPEDCGGIPGYHAMLDVLADPRHPDHAQVAAYLEGREPAVIDEFPLRIAFDRIAARRNAARTRIARKSPPPSA